MMDSSCIDKLRRRERDMYLGEMMAGQSKAPVIALHVTRKRTNFGSYAQVYYKYIILITDYSMTG
jgi:hypothetical protein